MTYKELDTFVFKEFHSDYVGSSYKEEEHDDLESMAQIQSISAKDTLNPISKGLMIHDFDEKQSELECLLSQKVINLERLQMISSTGLPGEGGFRSIAWKVLLGYLPSSQDLWERELADNRLNYATLKDELLINPSGFTRRKDECLVSCEQDMDNADGLLQRNQVFHGDHPLSEETTCIWHQYFQDAEMAEQIDRDLLRTHPGMNFFTGNSSRGLKTQQEMRNVLLLFGKLNPKIRYVQGMNEVLAPLYYVCSTGSDEKNVSNAEADSFACFIRLLGESVDHFCEQLDNSSVGIHSTLSRLSELLKATDEELWQHLEISNKVNPQFYAFRWITLLLTQEFSFKTVLRIWDSILSNCSGVQEMLLRVCCAMIFCVRSKLLKGDFADNLYLLQHYPEINVEYLLQIAQELNPKVPF